MPNSRTAASYGPPEKFPRKSLASCLADAILSSTGKVEFNDELHWEFDRKTDQRNKALQKALETLRDAVRKAA